jgi:plasmid stabilization system protein ParE
MPRGDKSAYTNKQKRKAEHIEAGYKKRGVASREAERRAWATVNKQDRGGKKSGARRRGAKATHLSRSTSRRTGARTGRRASR